MKNVGFDSIQSWKVMVASFVIKFLTMGLIETAGMLMVASVYSFNVNREKASLPFTLVYCVRNVAGPLISYIGYIMGTRSSTLLGCLISSFAVGCCFFAKNILAVTVLWGILLGYFKDKQGSYVGVFYTIAASELLGCLLHFLIPVLNKYRTEYKSKENPDSVSSGYIISNPSSL